MLWGLSGSFTLPVFGGLVIPGYMMWVAVVYAALGSWLTYKIGRPLVRVNFDLQRFNADFRYRMVRVRENAESIALYRGEPDEERRLAGAFGRIFGVWWDFMRYNKRLTWFTAFYGQAADVFPLVVASPRYFMGQIPLGVLTQTAGAFGRVQGSLSWFVDVWPTLADWKATIDRLTTFGESMEAARQVTRTASGFTIERAAEPLLRLEGVEVALPNGRILLDHVDLEVRPGDRLVIQGPSGSGKTTLFRVLAGLWPFGRGLIQLPEAARLLFLPQKPYLPVGTLREALCFPESPDAYDLVAIGEALDGHRPGAPRRPARRGALLVAGAVARGAAAPRGRARAAAAPRLAVPRRGDLGARRGDGGEALRPAAGTAARGRDHQRRPQAERGRVPRPPPGDRPGRAAPADRAGGTRRLGACPVIRFVAVGSAFCATTLPITTIY